MNMLPPTDSVRHETLGAGSSRVTVQSTLSASSRLLKSTRDRTRVTTRINRAVGRDSRLLARPSLLPGRAFLRDV